MKWVVRMMREDSFFLVFLLLMFLICGAVEIAHELRSTKEEYWIGSPEKDGVRTMRKVTKEEWEKFKSESK